MQNSSPPQPNKTDKVMLGRFQINPLMILYVPILFCTPLYTYHMAVKHGQTKKFPAATVTDTACHYPQDIVFRYTMLIASSIISLTFFIIFRWLQNECTRVGHKRLSRWYLYVTEFSMICYSITIGTIDEKGIGKLHSPCAVTFFVVWIIIILRITMFISKVRQWDTSIVSTKSLLIKKLLAFYVLGVWIYCIYGLLTTSDKNSSKKDKFVVIVQWNSVLINLLWVLSFICQWRELNFCLDFYPKQQAQINTLNNQNQQQINYPYSQELNACTYQNQPQPYYQPQMN